MLDHLDRHRRQLLDLVAHRLAHRDPLGRAEHVPTVAAIGPVLDEPIDRRHRQQLPPAALMAGLGALAAARTTLAPLGLSRRRILAGRLRGVARGPPQPALELGDPLVLARHTLGQPPDLIIHPQQDRDHRVTALVIDRLGLGALHTTEFAALALCPPDRLNAYHKPLVCSHFS